MEKYSEVTYLSGDTFKLNFHQEYKKDEIVRMGPSGFTVKVKKVYKFTLWKQFLFWLGYDFKSMDLEEVKNESNR